MLNIQANIPMKNIVTLGIGGPAKEFISVKTEEELIEAIKYAKEKGVEFLVIGGGSNLLVADEGINKLVIKNEVVGVSKVRGDSEEGSRRVAATSDASEDARRDTELAGPRIYITAKSGTVLQDLVNFANENGLAGLEKMAGIPGTVGGAVFGNAGAYGQTISDNIIEVKTLNPSSASVKTLTKDQSQFGYRDSAFKKNGLVILEVKFLLVPKPAQDLKKESTETIAKRNPKYPPGIKCPGSFFKNILAKTLSDEVLRKIPEEKIPYGKVSVGFLLEEVGAKGDSLGNIEIAPYHANLFINKGSGTAKDFYNLAKKYKKIVSEKFGIVLEPEVQLIGLPVLN